MSGQLHTLLYFLLLLITPSTHWVGGWVDPRAGLDAVMKRKIFPLLGIEPWLSSL
jgi:hypothetical protein